MIKYAALAMFLAFSFAMAAAPQRTLSQKQHACTEALLFADAAVIRQGVSGADSYADQIKAECQPGRPITLSPEMGAAYVSRLCDFSKSIFVGRDGYVACVVAVEH